MSLVSANTIQDTKMSDVVVKKGKPLKDSGWSKFKKTLPGGGRFI